MCFSNAKHFDDVANKMIYQIKTQTKYKWIEAEDIETLTGTIDERIGNIILEDKNGERFLINPNSNGLKFALGEITYKDYVSLEKKDSVKLFSIFFGSIGGIISIMLIISAYFI